MTKQTGCIHFLVYHMAKPPIGELRWHAPQPMDAWDGVRQADSFGKVCRQKHLWDDIIFRGEGQSEDCLYLNVWTPAKTTSDLLPVLVYYHGGGLAAGSGCEPRDDGAALAKEGIVVVTVNYRLNIFGFFSHPQLSEQSESGGSGNYGYLDQVAALQWVSDNISAFGGNPDQITIAGESAGSISVSHLMTSPLTKDLIAGGIGQSGAGLRPTLFPVAQDEAEQEGVKFAEQFKTTLDELMAMSTEDLFKLFEESGRFSFPTVIDNHFITRTIPELYEEGTFSDVPLLIGWTSAEIPGDGMLVGDGSSSENFVAALRAQQGEKVDDFLRYYPAGAEQVRQSATDYVSDNFIVYSTWKWSDLHRKFGSAPVYRYRFDQIRHYGWRSHRSSSCQ